MIDRRATACPSPHLTAWLLVFALGFVWLFPMLTMRGMSLDGVVYATVARNMAVGIGDTWRPVYNVADEVFYEQPPLALTMESVPFRVLGDKWWVERFYSVSTSLPTALLLTLIWRRLLHNRPRLGAYAWLPISLWIALPAWAWIYRNNYLENTLGIFSALAVYGSLRAAGRGRWWFAWTVLAAAAILAALLCKGPVGLFPLVTPTVIGLSLREQAVRKTLLVQITLALLLAAAVALLLAVDAPREFLNHYFHQQVLNALGGRREIVDSALGQFELLWDLVYDLLPCAALAGGCMLLARWRRLDARVGELGGPIWFCLLTGASASLPIIISPKQSGYYAAPSWPFYAMALALGCLPSAEALLNQASLAAAFAKTNRRLRVLAGGAVAATVALSPLWAGSLHRDHRIIHDAQRIAQTMGPGKIAVLAPEVEKEWSLQAYLYRMYYISAITSDCDDGPLYRLDFAGSARPLPAGFTALDSGATLYRVSKRSRLAALLSSAAVE